MNDKNKLDGPRTSTLAYKIGGIIGTIMAGCVAACIVVLCIALTCWFISGLL